MFQVHGVAASHSCSLTQSQPQGPFPVFLLALFLPFPLTPVVTAMSVDTPWSGSGILLTGAGTLGW